MKELRSTLEELRVKFKFFSTSLLIVSEGCIGRSTRKRHNSSSGDEDEDSMDSIESSLEIGSNNKSMNEHQLLTSRKPMYFNCTHREHSRQIKNQFDIRMIDFAHTSFSSNSSTTNSTTTTQSDGFLLGLNSLIKLLTEIREQERSCREEEPIECDSDDDVDDDDDPNGFHANYDQE